MRRLAVAAALLVAPLLAPLAAHAAGTGSIAGTVTDRATGAPLGDICVSVNGNDPFGNNSGSAETATDGTYVVAGLATDSYYVRFRGCSSDTPYAAQQIPASGPPTVQVTDGTATTGIDAALDLAGSFSGTITDRATGDPLDGMCASAHTGTTGWSSRPSAADGSYRLTGLPPGDYDVDFYECTTNRHYIASSMFSNGTPPRHVHVDAGTDTPGVDSSLVQGGSVSGHITEVGGGRPNFACAWLFQGGQQFYGTNDGGSGWSLDRVPPGTYLLRFGDCISSERYYPRWYDEVDDPSEATPITVGPGDELRGLDGTVEPLVLGTTPLVASVGPRVGSTGGGTEVTVRGYNLLGPDTVTFGGVPAQIRWSTDHEVHVVAPPHAAGTVAVVVTGRQGTSEPTARSQYSYDHPAPTIEALAPATGGNDGGDLVVIRGGGLEEVTSATVDGVAVPVEVASSAELRMTMPAHPNGDVEVRVTGPGGSASATYRYGDRPVVRNVLPNIGSHNGGAPVVLVGSHLTGTTQVLIGGHTATGVTVLDDSHVRAIAPWHEAGSVQQVVVVARGIRSRPAGTYRYV